MEFYKAHGIGNDFVLIDARTTADRDWPELARAMCDRHFGVGADGILLVLNSATADFRMRMLNPDGSEAEMCGNGIRCFARYVYENVAPKAELRVETGAGVLPLTLRVRDGVVEAVTVNMGAPHFTPRDIPVVLDHSPVVDHPLDVGGMTLRLTCVSMGNPHAVAFVEEDVESFPLAEIGPLVERHPLFPRRVNFEVCRVLGRGELDVRVWERGAGLTLACGTGASAVTVAARLKGLTDERIRLRLPGGTLEMSWDGQGDVFMTGPAEFVFRGEWLK